jgi:glycine/D-amino acid oxidase-like deaminating enzyme
MALLLPFLATREVVAQPVAQGVDDERGPEDAETRKRGQPPGRVVANLHFGLTLAPLTGRILAACVLGREPEVALTPYLPDRSC